MANLILRSVEDANVEVVDKDNTSVSRSLEQFSSRAAVLSLKLWHLVTAFVTVVAFLLEDTCDAISMSLETDSVSLSL